MADKVDDVVLVTNDKLSVEDLSRMVTHPSAGGIASFCGITRDNFNGKKVLQLEYEAYVPMAKKEMKKICDKVREKWTGIVGIAMAHRLGVVPVSESSVIIVVSSIHRQDGLEACHWAIDELKATVPVWKKEIYEDGSEWKGNVEFSDRFLRHEGGCMCGSKSHKRKPEEPAAGSPAKKAATDS